MSDGGTAEVGLIGREGIVGSFHLLGPPEVSTSCFVQLTATALRLPFPELARTFRENEETRNRILEFAQEQAVSLGQLAGCNRPHESEKRLSRWLLMARDRTHSDTTRSEGCLSMQDTLCITLKRYSAAFDIANSALCSLMAIINLPADVGGQSRLTQPPTVFLETLCTIT
jgi:CRP-like cAMP-binding protein